MVALNAVIGLAYYLRVAAALWRTGADARPAAASRGGAAAVPVLGAVALVLAVATVAAVVLGFAPQLVLDLGR